MKTIVIIVISAVLFAMGMWVSHHVMTVMAVGYTLLKNALFIGAGITLGMGVGIVAMKSVKAVRKWAMYRFHKVIIND